MANVSAFGFGGYDYIGSVGEGKISTKLGLSAKKKSNAMDMRYQKAMMDYQQKLQQEQMQFQSALNQKNQIWAANAMPEQTVKGLRAANLNPLLAYSDFSGLASSGAMGVSPSSVGGASPGSTVDVDMGSGSTSGFDADAIDKLRYRKQDTKQRVLLNEQIEAGIESSRAGAVKSHAEAEKTAATIPSARALAATDTETQFMDSKAKQAESATRMREASLRQQQIDLESYKLHHEENAARGKKSISLDSSDTMDEFWNDYYREKQSLEKYMNSALRQKAFDAIGAGKDIAGAIGHLKGKSVNIHNNTTNNTDNRSIDMSTRTTFKRR